MRSKVKVESSEMEESWSEGGAEVKKGKNLVREVGKSEPKYLKVV